MERQETCSTEPGKHRREAQRVGKQKGKRVKKYDSEGKSLFKSTGNMKKPLTEVGKLLEAQVWDHKSLTNFSGVYSVERWERVTYKC